MAANRAGPSDGKKDLAPPALRSRLVAYGQAASLAGPSKLYLPASHPFGMRPLKVLHSGVPPSARLPPCSPLFLCSTLIVFSLY